MVSTRTSGPTPGSCAASIPAGRGPTSRIAGIRESWIISWGPRVSYDRNYDFEGILQDEGKNVGLSMSFAKSINLLVNVNRDMERFLGVNFNKTRYSVGGGVNTSRRIGIGGFFSWGDQVLFSATPFLGNSVSASVFLNLRPSSRFQTNVNMTTSRLVDPSTFEALFDVKIFRAFSTFQFTERLLLRNIMEYNTFNRTLGANLLLTYRVNSRHGVLHRLRRSLPARRPDFRRQRRPTVFHDRFRADQPGLFHQGLVSVPVLELR